MATTPGDAQNKSVVTTVINSGLRPQLFVVPLGTYVSNVVYGSGTPALTPTYDAVTLRNSPNSLNFTSAKLRRNDRNFDFDVQITLDTSDEDPWGGQEVAGELRIRTQQPLTAGQPGAYLNKIPVPIMGLPRIDNVEILDEDGGNVLPTQANNILQARFLLGGEIALIRRDLTAAPELSAVPLLTTDLSPLFGEATTVRIIVRGTYLINANPTGH